MIDERLIDTGYTAAQPRYISSNNIQEIILVGGEQTIDLLVEILARSKWGDFAEQFHQYKGISEIHNSKIEINNEEIEGVQLIAMEFNNAWVKGYYKENVVKLNGN